MSERADSTPAGLRVVFLAAGFGTRLLPLTRDRAKPLLEVGGEPILSRLLRQVERTGLARDVVVVTNGRFHEDFVRWSREVETDLPLALVDDRAQADESRLGAIADLRLALERCPFDAPVDGHLVLAADNVFEFDLGEPIRRYLAGGASQLVVRRVPQPVPPRRYNEVTLDASGRVLSFREKPAEPGSDLAAIAVYVLPRELPELVAGYLAQGGNPDAPGHLIAWLVGRAPVEATALAGPWHDVGNLEDWERIRAVYGEDA